jgi:hypothetical protein
MAIKGILEMRWSAVWRSSARSSELYRSGGTPCFAAKSMKAALGVRDSSAFQRDLIFPIKFEGQQPSGLLHSQGGLRPSLGKRIRVKSLLTGSRSTDIK